ncbi:MAG: hypothetical protein IPH84_05190 [Bacteroidales bacterium]|nr:hypothetical protein [Bacteroidales bacterium]
MTREKEINCIWEDICQVTERLTEDKYHGSYEQVAKAIWKFSANLGIGMSSISLNRYYFTFLTRNADMHSEEFLSDPSTGNW